MTKTVTKVAQDLTTATSRIFWSEDEKNILFEAILEVLESSAKPMETWVITARMVMKAQIDFLPEERFRETLSGTVVPEFQARLDAYIHEQTVTRVVQAHKEYVVAHGLSPIDHAKELTFTVSKLQRELHEGAERESQYAAQVTSLAARIESLEAALEKANSNLIVPAEPALNLKADSCSEPDVLSADNVVLPVMPNEPPKVKIKVAKKVEKLPMFIGASKLSASCRLELSKINPDILYVEPKDDMQDIKRKAANRVTILMEGYLPSALIKAARAAAFESHLLGSVGQSGLIQAVQQRMDEHRKNLNKKAA